MLKHKAPISGIASFENKYIATAGYDNRVVLWNPQTKNPLAVGYHDHLANQCEFSQCGNFLVSASSDHTARLWSIPQMKLQAVFCAHDDDIECTAIHPTQTYVATASRDKKVRVFDFSGKLLQTFIGHEADVISVQWLAEENKLISSSDDGTIRCWDFTTGKQIQEIKDTGAQTDALAIAADGTIFAGDDNGKIHVFKEQKQFSVTAHQSGIKKLIYAPQQKKLISLAYDRKVCLWHVSPQSELTLILEFALPNIVWPRSCAFHGDDEIVFATFGDSYAVFNYKTQLWQLDHVGHTQGINAVLSVDSDIWTIGDSGVLKKNQQSSQILPSLCNFLLLSGSDVITGGQTGEIFNGLTGKVIYQHHSPLNCAVTYKLNNQQYIAVGTYTGEAVILQRNVESNYVFSSIVKLHDNAIKGLAINDNKLFSVCATGAAAWHDLQSYAALKLLPQAHTKIANGCVALDTNFFASISRDRILRIWKATECTLAAEIPTPHTHSIKSIATDTHSRYIATGSYNGLIAIFDRVNNTWHKQRVTHAGISSLCFDVLQNCFLASSYDGNVYPILLDSDYEIN